MPPNDQIWSQIREAADIVEIIGEHVALRRAGKEFKGLCPFHPDHRPSMSVVPQKQIFHCFVCGTGGDVFKFVELFHKMSKGETLRFLAQRTGIKLPELNPQAAARSAEKRSLRETITELNERAASFFEKNLYAAAGKEGLNYLRSRGLSDDTIKAFRLGFAPDSWTAFCDYASRLGIPPDALVNAGLAKKRGDGSPYDAFRNRVIFPIVDGTSGQNRIIAFGGRILQERRDEAGNIVEAKYLNSPETPVFNKSQSLYGLDRAKQQIIKTQTAVVVEGYMDVIACHQAGGGGVTNVVATLGTALTLEHARILKRFCNTVVLIFDSDDAGFRAADRAMQTFVKEPIDVKIASVPDGKDPCDFCTARGDSGGVEFQKVIDSAVDMLDYQWTRLQKQFAAHTGLSARSEAAKEFIRFVAQGMEGSGRDMDPIRRGMLFAKIGKMVGLDVSQVSAALARASSADAPHSYAPAPVSYTDVHAETPEAHAPTRPFHAHALLGHDAAEAWVLGSLLTDPKLYDTVREDMSLALFSPACLQHLASALLEYLESTSDLATCSLADFTSTLEDATLRNQAIQLESLSSEVLNPSNFSPETERVVKNQQADMGRTLGKRLAEALQELIHARGDTAPHVESNATPNTPADPTANFAKLIAKAQERNKKGGNQRIVGPSTH